MPSSRAMRAGHDRGVAVGHLLEVIDQGEVHVLREEVLADALGDVRVDLVLVEDPGFLVLLEHRPVGVDAPGLHRGLLLLQVLGRAADGAARADAHHEVVDLAAGLLPDLGARLLVVRLRVRRVVVLVGLPRIRRLALEARRHRVVRPRILGIHVGGTHDDLGAERAKGVHLLLRLLVGGGEDALVALHDGRDGQAHAGVAGRALDDRAARLQLPRLLRVLDHLDGHAVLDRVAGIDGFDLGQDVGLDDALGNAVEANERRVADRLEDVGVNVLGHDDATEDASS